MKAWHGIHLSHKKSMKSSGHRKLLYELSKLSNLMLLTYSDTKRTLMHLFLFTNSVQRELVSICTQCITRPQLTFLALHPCSCLSSRLILCSINGKNSWTNHMTPRYVLYILKVEQFCQEKSFYLKIRQNLRSFKNEHFRSESSNLNLLMG